MRKLNDNQKAIAIGCSCGLIVLMMIGGWYGWSKQKNAISSELSGRSQEFLKDHKSSVTDAAVEFGDGKAFQADVAIDGPCFSLVVPFSSKKASGEEPQGSCTVRLLTEKPNAHLVISARAFSSVLSDDPAIQLRRDPSFGYHESSVSATKYPKIARFDDSDTVSVFWLTAGKMLTVAFTGVADTTKIDNERLVKLIESIVLNTTPTKVKSYDATTSAIASPSAHK